MSRIRTIKPDFYLDEEIAALHPLTRILFTGLWCLADKAGRLEDRPAKIKVQILPYDKHDVDAELTVLADRGFIIRYEVDGKKLIQIRSFSKNQRPHHTEKESELPEHNGSLTVKAPLEGREEPDGKERKGKEGKGREYTPAKFAEKEKKTKTPVPENFTVSDDVKKWAVKKGYTNLEEHLESFKAKCAANGYHYLDWDAAFREAIRADWAKVRAGGNGRTYPTKQQVKLLRPSDVPDPDQEWEETCRRREAEEHPQA